MKVLLRALVAVSLAIPLGALLAPSAWLRAASTGQAQPQPARPATPGQRFQEAVTLMDARGDYAGAIRIFEEIAGGTDRPLAARALVYLGACYERLGREEARKAYRRVIDHFADQRSAVAEARARLAALERARPAPVRRTVRLQRAWERVPPEFAGIGGVSANGRLMAVRTRNGDIAIVDLGTAQPRLTIPAARLSVAGEEGGAWPGPIPSPDGRAAAFTWQGADQAVELRRVDADGGRARTLARAGDGEWVSAEQWTPRGHLLVRTSAADASARFGVADAATGRVLRELTNAPARVDRIALSPDEGHFAWSEAAADGTHTDVWLAPLSGGERVAVAPGPANDVMPVWTPDGRALLFVSDRTGTAGLWMQVVADGRPTGDPRLLQQDIGRIVGPLGLTTDGAFHYYRQVGLVDVHTVELDERGRAVSAPAAAPRRFVGSNMMPTWSPDGGRLAYVAQLAFAPTDRLDVLDVATGASRALPSVMRWARLPRWSPDGHHLLVKGNDADNRYGLFRVDVETGTPRPVLTVPPRDESTLGVTLWGPTEETVVYTRPEGGGTAIVSRRVEGGAEQVVLPVGPDWWLIGNPPIAVRDDGTLAFVKATAQAVTVCVRTTDGAEREVWRGPAAERLMSIAWQPPGTHLLVARVPQPPPQGQPAVAQLWRLDASTGEASPVGVEMVGIRDLSVSRDGRRVAFTAGWPTREVWVLENFLPAPPATRAARANRARQ